MPGFYHQPKTIDDLVDFVVGRIVDQQLIIAPCDGHSMELDGVVVVSWSPINVVDLACRTFQRFLSVSQLDFQLLPAGWAGGLCADSGPTQYGLSDHRIGDLDAPVSCEVVHGLVPEPEPNTDAVDRAHRRRNRPGNQEAPSAVTYAGDYVGGPGCHGGEK